MPRLMIGRKSGQRVLIQPPGGPEIWVSLERDGGHVRLVIEAPGEVQIVHEELLSRKEAQRD